MPSEGRGGAGIAAIVGANTGGTGAAIVGANTGEGDGTDVTFWETPCKIACISFASGYRSWGSCRVLQFRISISSRLVFPAYDSQFRFPVRGSVIVVGLFPVN
ncbi:MAG TPA: hypothetical protein PKZ53_28570, partial [Acidobacteriota bacterium]|nr:hypothetical protein [Acidobacteriota bacterium]